MSGERGSTLLFFPAALLAVVVLASVCVDGARVHLHQRQVDDLAAGAANDAVTVGLDRDSLRVDGVYRLAADQVERVVATHADRHEHTGLAGLRVRSSLVGPRAVVIDVEARVPLGFARVVPGAPDAVVIRARAEARSSVR